MPQLPLDNVALPRSQFYLGDKLLENSTRKKPSKTCSISISQYSADGSSGEIILALYPCRMTSALTPYLPVYRCFGFACIGSFQNFDFFGRVLLHFLLQHD